jgi:long-chain acyl-CoA synthetase
VRAAAERSPDKPAFLSGTTSTTWREVDARVDAAAAALTGLGLQPGDRVALSLANTLDFPVAYFAVLRAGLVAVPLNPGYTAPELRHVLADCGAAVLVAGDDVRERVAGLRDELPGLAVVPADLPAAPDGPTAPDLPAAPDGPAAPEGRPGDGLAVLLYTSGTEGRPKGAMLTHGALMANHEQVAHIRPPVIGADDVVLLGLPLFHAYGLNSGLGAVAYHGACGVLVERFDPADSLALVERHHVTVVVGVPSMFVGWSLLPGLGGAMASVRLAVCGAAPLEPATAARFTDAAGHPVFVGYGLTEAAPAVTSTLLSPVPKAGSIGQPLPGVELRLCGASGQELWRHGADPHPDEDEDELEFDLVDLSGTDPGEIVVRGANLFSGYWPDGRGGPDADGWWATGDVAYADGDGDLFLVDRIGELILVNGFNVYPQEVERVLGDHPGIAESAVVGVPHPYTGQTVRAYLVRAPGATVTAEEVLRHCERNLARFKCPTSVEFVDELPHSAIGKVRKTLLRTEGSGE